MDGTGKFLPFIDTRPRIACKDLVLGETHAQNERNSFAGGAKNSGSENWSFPLNTPGRRPRLPCRPALNPELGPCGGEEDPARGLLFRRGRELDAYRQAQAEEDFAGGIDGEAVGAVEDAGVIAGQAQVVEGFDEAGAVVDVDGVDGRARGVMEEDVDLGELGTAAIQQIGHGKGDMEPVGGVFLAPKCGAPALAGDLIDVIGIFRVDDISMHADGGFGCHGFGGGVRTRELHMDLF